MRSPVPQTNQLFIELLNNSGLIADGTPNLRKIATLSKSDIVDFAHQALELTSLQQYPRQVPTFYHSASLSLSGDRSVCNNVECRLTRVKNLGHFAALYSDRVFLKNPLSRYEIVDHSSLERVSQSSIQRDLSEDLAVIAHLIPFVEQGRIVPINPPRYCPGCFNELVLRDNPDADRFGAAIRQLTRRYNQGSKFALRQDKHFYSLVARGPEGLLPPHGEHFLMSQDPPRFLSQMPLLAAKIKPGVEVKLSRSVVKKIGFDASLASRIGVSAAFELFCAQFLQSAYLSDEKVEVDFIRSLRPEPGAARRDELVERQLTCLVPFLGDLSPVDLLKLRSSEEDSFILFRQALDQVIAEYRESRATFSAEDAKALYHDVIRPRLARLDLKLRTARKSILKSATGKAIGWTAAISFGLYAGFLPNSLIAAAGALGLTKILADWLQDMLSLSDVKHSLRDDELYFLWRVQESAKDAKRYASRPD